MRKVTNAQKRNAWADRDKLLHRCRGPRRNHLCRFVLRSLKILGFSIDLLRRPYNTLALPCECVMMPAARLLCQRPSSIFPYFRTPLDRKLFALPPELRIEYGNSKTTTLLPSAKCTRPLFQGQTGCGGRPSGWHDIVTCQRLVSMYFESYV